MNKMQKHNLYNIKRAFERKTGTRLMSSYAPAERRTAPQRRVFRPAVLIALVCALCLMLAAFTWPLFSPLDGDALVLSATYEGNGVVSIQVENRSHKKLEFQPQTKLVKWITGEEVTPMSDKIAFDDLTIEPRSTETITLDISEAYDMTVLEQSLVTEWYYLVLTNYNFVFGQEWKCSVYFGTQQLEEQERQDLLYEIDPGILAEIEDELRFYFEDDYYGIFAGNPLHYEYLQKAQELLQRSGKNVVGMADPGLVIEPIRDGVVIDETYPLEHQYALCSENTTVRDAFGKLVGFTEDQHIMKLCVYTEDGWELPILYYAAYEQAAVDSNDSYAFIYGQLISFDALEDCRVYQDEMYYCYDVTHLFYTDLRSYFDEVAAMDPGYYENAEKYWTRIQNVYNYYKENIKLMSFEEWIEIKPTVRIDNETYYEDLTTEGLYGSVTSNYDMETIVITITAESGEEIYSCEIEPADPRSYDLADVPGATDALKTLIDGKYTMEISVCVAGADFMSCMDLWSCTFYAGEASVS